MKGYDSLLFRALIGANQLEFKEYGFCRIRGI